MLIIARVTQLLAQIAFADQDDADAGDLFQNSRQVVDGAGLFALDDDENFSVWRERPDVGAFVIFLLRQSPIARRARRRVAANPRRVVARRGREARIAAGADGVPGLFHRAYMRENNAEHADIEHLLGDPTIHFNAVRWNAHDRRHRGSERGAVDKLAAVEHELERLAQPRKVERRVLHLEGDAVELGARHGNGVFNIDGRERDKSGLALFEGFDYTVKAGYVWHVQRLL